MSVNLLAKAVLVNPDGDVLVMKRHRNDNLRPGKLDLPGGGVEDGENVVAAVGREVDEEAGIQLTKDDFTIVYAVTTEATDEEPALIRVLFVAKVDTTEVTMDAEHEDYYWVSVDRAIELLKGRPFGDGIAFAHRHNLIPV